MNSGRKVVGKEQQGHRNGRMSYNIRDVPNTLDLPAAPCQRRFCLGVYSNDHAAHSPILPPNRQIKPASARAGKLDLQSRVTALTEFGKCL